MTRYQDWPDRFEASVAAAAPRSFRYGKWDCCLAVADIVAAMTGTDLAAPYRGRYSSRKEALRLGNGALRGFLEEALSELPSIPVLCAQRGDIVLVQRPRDVSLGLIALNGKAILAASRKGFMLFSLSLAVRAWRV